MQSDPPGASAGDRLKGRVARRCARPRDRGPTVVGSAREWRRTLRPFPRAGLPMRLRALLLRLAPLAICFALAWRFRPRSWLSCCCDGTGRRGTTSASGAPGQPACIRLRRVAVARAGARRPPGVGPSGAAGTDAAVHRVRLDGGRAGGPAAMDVRPRPGADPRLRPRAHRRCLDPHRHPRRADDHAATAVATVRRGRGRPCSSLRSHCRPRRRWRGARPAPSGLRPAQADAPSLKLSETTTRGGCAGRPDRGAATCVRHWRQSSTWEEQRLRADALTAAAPGPGAPPKGFHPAEYCA